MKLVIVESPYAASATRSVEEHAAYARRCLLDALRRGEAPFMSHLLYTQVLDDLEASQRHLGIEAGLAWGAKADATVVYADLGVSRGMQLGIERAGREGRPVEWRYLHDAPGEDS